MKRVGALALCLVLVGVVGADDNNSLKEYAAKMQGRHAYGVYLMDKKLGWMILDVKLGKHDGKDVLISTEEMLAELKRGGASVKMEMKTSGIFALTGDGDLLVYEDRRKGAEGETVWRGVRKGDKFVISISTAPGNERSVAPPKRNLMSTRKIDDWLRSSPKKDAKFNSWSVSLDENDIDAAEEYTYKDKKSLTLGGVMTDIFSVHIKSKGAVSEAEMRSDGTPLRSSIGGFDIRSEPEATAKKPGAANVDLLDLASIPCDRDLGDPDRVESLTLTVTGLGDYELPTSHRQVRRPGADKESSVLELKRDFKAEKAEELTAAQRKAMLLATPRVQSDSARVKEQAKKVIGSETDVHKQARLLNRWVYQKVRKSFSDNPNTTLEVLNRMAGDCKHHALLFVSLARAAGIPAREVGGVGYCGIGSKAFGWHAWAEYHDGHQWVSIDPTWDQERVDATHVKFSDSAEDMAWVNVLGKVKFKVADVKRK